MNWLARNLFDRLLITQVKVDAMMVVPRDQECLRACLKTPVWSSAFRRQSAETA